MEENNVKIVGGGNMEKIILHLSLILPQKTLQIKIIG
jgi:hypothetical protein